MMIKCERRLLPNEFTVAVSGGRDSMAALDFLRRGPYQIRVAVFDHGTGFHDFAFPVVERYCREHSLPVLVGGPAALDIDTRTSPEELWRQQRYQWLDSLNTCLVLAHQLDDQVETWLWSSCHGQSKLIPAVRANTNKTSSYYVRPFLLTPRSGFTDWCEKYGVDYVDDPANCDLAYSRSRVRRQLIPAALTVNPGLYTMIGKKTAQQYQKAVDTLADLVHNN